MQPQMQPIQTNTFGRSADQVAIRNRVLRNTYVLLALTMIPTIVGAMIGLSTNFSFMAANPIAAPLLMLAVMMGMLFGVMKLRNSVWGIALLFGFTFVAGWWLGPMLQVALGMSNGAQLIGMAAGGTGIVFAAMATIATTSKRDFSFMGKFLFVGLIVLIVAMLANMFFQIPALTLTISAAAVFLFSMFLLFDLNRIVNGGETNYVMATMAIYLDIYNLFIHLLNLLMMLAGNRE